MKIFLIRHGETDWNKQGRFQGREDIELNENGIRQAQNCGRALAGENFAAVITSPLSRARRTAEMIAGHLGVNNIIIEEGIIERDFSKLAGLLPKEREEFYASGKKDDKEPFDQLSKRMFQYIKKYAEEYIEQNLIMVSHGASINSVLSVLSHGKTGTEKIRLKNACINILHYQEGHMSIEVINLSPEEYTEWKSAQKDGEK